MGGILCSAKLFLGKTLTDRNRHIHQSRRKGRSYVMLTRGRPKPLLSVPAETRPQLRNDYKALTEPDADTLWRVSKTEIEHMMTWLIYQDIPNLQTVHINNNSATATWSL